ncbi:MAG: transglutaminase-like domain-containing protein [Pseudomonadota bacterium]|nr:transglutaminase-like domain-containing protein [Pseudomonadota bacterium]
MACSVVLVLGAVVTAPVVANDEALATVIRAVDGGQFADAEKSIAAALAGTAANADSRREFEFQRERMRRIRLDFTLGADEAKARVRQQVPDLRDDEFAKWDAAGLIEHYVIDGETRYFSRAPSNLFRVSPQAAARRASPKPFVDGPMERLNPHHAEVRAQALDSGRAGVAPRRIRVTQSLIVNADAVPPGETVRAWIPYPRALPGQQENIGFIRSVPGKHVIAPESTLQRTVYLEQPAKAGEATAFSIEYDMTVLGQYHAVDAKKITPVVNTEALAAHLGERAPHIVFTDAIRKFSREVIGDETNPYRIAQKLFAAVDRIPWAGAREYSTITNISDYALHAGHADCGQQTLLLMTLLRFNGIPARWQSGMVYSDGSYDNLHDWGWMYLAPYGWIPMDVTTGRLSGDPSLEWFYLGGLDAYRIAFNDDYGTDLVPAKTHFRSETVDSQRGEAEWRGGNLYFDQWDYTFKATPKS